MWIYNLSINFVNQIDIILHIKGLWAYDLCYEHNPLVLTLKPIPKLRHFICARYYHISKNYLHIGVKLMTI